MSETKLTINNEEYRIIENLGYQPGIGLYAKTVRDTNGDYFTAVGSRGVWRIWTPFDRIGKPNRSDSR